jgi:hypothetical protein
MLMRDLDNLKHSKLWRNVLTQMRELGITQMTGSTVLGKFELSRIKAALEALESVLDKREWQNVDKALNTLLTTSVPFNEIVKCYSIPKCPGPAPASSSPPIQPVAKSSSASEKSCEDPILGQLEAMAAVQEACIKKDRTLGRNTIASIRQRLRGDKENA